MRLPDTHLEFGGRTVAVEKLEQVMSEMDGRDYETAVYQDGKGNLYLAGLTQRTIEDMLAMTGCPELRFPLSPELEAMRETRLAIRKVSTEAALAWYVSEVMNETPLKEMMREALREYTARARCKGAEPLTAWASRALARRLARAAHRAGISPQQQLLLFAEEGLQRAAAPRAAARRRPAAPEGGCVVQLQLATALVEVLARFEAAPAPETLSRAQETVSALQQSLHSPETVNRAVA